MAIYHDAEDKKSTFAGGTLGQAMAKHKFLKKAKEKIKPGQETHTKGTLSATQQADPRHVDEEEEAPTAGEPGGEGLAYSGS